MLNVHNRIAWLAKAPFVINVPLDISSSTTHAKPAPKLSLTVPTVATKCVYHASQDLFCRTDFAPQYAQCKIVKNVKARLALYAIKDSSLQVTQHALHAPQIAYNV